MSLEPNAEKTDSPKGSPEPSQTPSPPQSGSSWEDLAEIIGPPLRWMKEYLLAITAVLYALGFIIAVFHFHSRGVPVSRIGHSQFLGAALAYVAFTGSALLEAHYLARRQLSFLKGLVGVVAASTAVYVCLVAMQAIHVIPAIIWAVLCGTCFLSWFLSDSLRWNATRPLAIQRPIVSYWVVIGGAIFAIMVYPFLPQWIGGGQARPVTIVLLDTAQQNVKNALAVTDPKKCAAVFEVLRDEHDLYLMISERPFRGTCEGVFRPLFADFHWYEVQNRYVTIPGGSIALLSYPPEMVANSSPTPTLSARDGGTPAIGNVPVSAKPSGNDAGASTVTNLPAPTKAVGESDAGTSTVGTPP